MKRFFSSVSASSGGTHSTAPVVGDALSVFMDLESTGLSTLHDDIIQIAAECPALGTSFVEYAHTKKTLRPIIVELTGITQAQVDAAPPIATVLARFFEELSRWRDMSNKPEITLTAYNGYSFDFPMLQNACDKKTNIHFAQRARAAGVMFFADALVWARKHISPSTLPRTRRGAASYRQTDVYFALFNEKYEAHRADADTGALARVCDTPMFVHDQKSEYVKTRDEFLARASSSVQPSKKRKRAHVQTTSATLVYLRSLHAESFTP